MSSSENLDPMVPPGIVHPSALRQRPSNGKSDEEIAWSARRYGQFKNVQEPSHPFPGLGYLPHMPPKQPLGRQLQHDAWAGTYGNLYPPLLPMQPSVPPIQQWQGFIGDTGFYNAENKVPLEFEYHGPSEILYDSNLQPEDNDELRGQPQQRGNPPHRGQPHRGQPHHRGQPPNRGQPQMRGSHSWGSGRGRGFALPPPRLATAPPNPEKMSTPQAQTAKPNKDESRGYVWKDRSQAPQPSGKYFPPPLPQVDLDFVAKVGDTVRIRPWADEFTWVEGRVEKADLSLIKYCKPSPRYVVSYIQPASKKIKQRAFCSHLSEIMVREPDEPGLQPLPKGTERNVYACVPPPVQRTEGPIGMSWAHARILKIDENGHLTIRVLVGPSKDLIFDGFRVKYTLPFTKTSRARLRQMGFVVAGNVEHPLQQESKEP
ncbi:hypothetical protein C8F04DRAFT_215711 [Mycena alexandri]|uniref:Uncharacterized protein n=1 Tax=Mycena alexandri TaxID=1745969 RepID=A0AAD6XC45_9AGAR|nr:hypothetical protein C8F04DRAFT_215711 [Mycena alexandri]